MGQESRYFEASSRAKKFVKNIVAIDSLAACVDQGWPREEMFEEYHDRALETGITAIGMTVGYGPNDFMSMQHQAARILKHVNARSDSFEIVRTTTDIARVQELGKHGLFFCAQGCEVLNNNPQQYAPMVRNSGVGTVALAYNEQFRSGDGCLVTNPDKITYYGQQVIEALHDNHILLDLSHASEPTALSAMEYSMKIAPETPVIYSHSTPYGVCDVFRSITDVEVEMCAATGGVISLVTLPWFIIDPMARETEPKDVVRAIDYVRDLVGIDHIGLSSDDTYSWPPVWEWAKTVPEMYQDGGVTMAAANASPTGSAEPAKIYPAIVDLMWENGYSDDDIKKVLGGNLMRVYEQVWGK
ncbi:membrane dipeptidase [Hellea sp.]|nr:membrane dipeptidase [Hellea sp.]MDB4845234.1 membrane dipeptidase [Hellea sp.]MDC0421992.1 membrane dipeptidase [Hellea sp.]MDC1088752.1 membrane dipeptidase [Hellea sp.]